MLTIFESALTRNFELASKHEWLETNGVGGFASGTLSGINSRRYHGLLVAATKPPLGRMVLVSKMDETLWVEGQPYLLGTNQYKNSVFPQGFQHLQRFEREFFPSFIYEIGPYLLKKTISAVHGENTTLVIYELLSGDKPAALRVQPLLAFRDFHALRQADGRQWHFNWEANTLQVKGANDLELYIQTPFADYQEQPDWYFQLEYQQELERGEGGYEDLYCPGSFYLDLQPGQPRGFILSTSPQENRDPLVLLEHEKERRRELIRPFASRGIFYQKLVLAADQFIVSRGDNLKTIIAGYPWFSDWGRDTMIALPGLCLATGRHEEARKILEAFAAEVSQGMIPNRFLDDGEEKEYNTVDATLWFFVAIYKYYLTTGNRAFVEKEMLPVLEEIIHCHIRGTRYNIRVDADGLLMAGENGLQLTWMDAKAGDWVVTPRIGKVVEINALWYNALRIYDFFLRSFGRERESEMWRNKALQTQVSFQEQFWNEEKSCLYDFLAPDGPQGDIRPNQIFAVSLPFPILTGEKAERVIRSVDKHLYTPFGLRSLSPEDPQYKGKYVGNRFSRDGAYHQGTVWGWLAGPYIDAIAQQCDASGVSQVREMMELMELHMNDAGIGSVSEIFDGSAPFEPRGCFAQAWSVSELLRVMSEYPWTRGHDFAGHDHDLIQPPYSENHEQVVAKIRQEYPRSNE